MSESTVVATEVESVLRAWAQAQAPERDFAEDRVFSFTQPVQRRDGVVFAPGELVLGHTATGEVADEAARRGFPPPLAIWSFEFGQEFIIPRGFVQAERMASDEAEDQAVA